MIDYIRSVWLTTGLRAKRFEQDFTEFTGGSVETIAIKSAIVGLFITLEVAVL